MRKESAKVRQLRKRAEVLPPEGLGDHHKQGEEELGKQRELVEELVEKRTAKLRAANQKLREEIAERKRAEETLRETQAQLIKVEKVGALGTMAAGIANELSSPMMAIHGFVEYCLKFASEDYRTYSILKDIEHETKRCIDIVKNLLTFSRVDEHGDEEYQKTSLAIILNRGSRLLGYRIEEENVFVTQQIAEETPEIWIKTGKIQQVFLNLMNNALDALEGSEKKEIHIDVRPEGEFVQVTVSDTGCGIPQENLQRIFDLFLTTKPVGEGTGLGLSVAQSIVEMHGGEITCESEVGAGTKFNVLLPVRKKPVSRC